MFESDPLFSIIITCYNYEAYVWLAIESALRQKVPDVEIIVVNDGSTDGSWEVILKYEKKIKPITTENCGFISACLTGLAASRGRYILFLDADDILHDDALSQVSSNLQSDVSKIQYMLQPVDSRGEDIGDPFPRLPNSYSNRQMIESINKFGYYPTPPTSGNVYRRDVYLTIGDIGYDYGIDGVAYLVAPFRGKVVHLNESLGQYRIHSNNMSGFGKPSFTKLEREKNVFHQRLEHLNALTLVGRGAVENQFVLRDNYLYTTEREVFVEIMKGNRLRFETLRRYLSQIRYSLSGVERLSYLAFAALLYILPNKQSKALIDFSINPRRNSRVRTFVKRIVRR